MTTIAVNKSSIACDLQATGAFKFKVKDKIYVPTKEVSALLFETDKSFVGFSGKLDKIAEALFHLHGEGKKKFPRLDLVGIALTDDKKIWRTDNFAYWYEIGDPYHAIGSGCEFAMAALGDGKAPIDAVKIAAKWDTGTGLGYKEYKF
jgi:hypothetical protein